MPTKSARLIASLILLPPLLLLAACSGDDDDDEPARYAEPRAYAGVRVAVTEWFGRNVVYIEIVSEQSPAQEAGLQQSDFIVAVHGESFDSSREFYAYLEERRPGDVLAVELDRFEGELPRDGSEPEATRLTLSLELVEEPLPGELILWTPYASLDPEDQLRLGFYLGEITRPVAEHYGLDGPEGVYLPMMPFPFTAASEAGLDEGDVIVELAGRKVDSLAQVQSVIDGIDEDEPIEVVVRRDDRNETHTLSLLGPNVPGANQFPAEARQRLKAAIDRGDLHPSRVEPTIRPHYWRTDPQLGEPGTRIGAITALSADSITIEIYSTGGEWTLQLRRPEPDLRVGEFVQVFSQDGRRASDIYSLAEPIERP